MIILVGGIKGGTGKSTIAFHLACQAALSGTEVITIDIDFPQFSFTRYYENRKRNKEALIWQEHKKIDNIEKLPEFDENKIYIIDTPGRYDANIKALHAKADIIITPVNDSFLDIDTIMQVEKDKWALPGYYCDIIFENKKQKPDSLWLVVRNRGSSIKSKHKALLDEKLEELSKKLNFTLMQGLKERNIFRELFSHGLTVLDLKAGKLSVSHIAAKMEIKMLWKAVANKIAKKIEER
jgi:chromosome partitioning protein